MNLIQSIFKCLFTFCCISVLSSLPAAEFTISSYNCGGLSNHYDYLHAVSMQKLMQERYIAEPENMARHERMEQLSLKIAFSNDPEEVLAAKQEWARKGYDDLVNHLSENPSDDSSPHYAWNQKIDQIITSYKIRPIIIHDTQVRGMLVAHIKNLYRRVKPRQPLHPLLTNLKRIDRLKEVRAKMAKTAFNYYMQHDIICLQEAAYLDAAMFPEHYTVLISDNANKTGIAWNHERFELIEDLGDVLGRALVVKLRDKENDQTVLVASGHLTGCNPYVVQNEDSTKGDDELKAMIERLNEEEVDFMLIGMDSNVTSLHPRLSQLKEAGYQIDCDNHIQPTCANSGFILNTRLDWLALKTERNASITNIPVLSIGLNSLETNMSDHKPIAAKVVY